MNSKSPFPGVQAGVLYRKEDFLKAARISDDTWQRWAKKTDFKKIVRDLSTSMVFILGDDFINWTRVQTCDDESSESSS